MREPAGDPEVVGWLDTAGLFTPGVLPADAGPCEAGCVGTACRQLCDDADGDGQAGTTYSELWCIRADGSAELSIPYTPIAPIDCTYGCPGSETVTLCDANGPILRRYTWLNGVASYEDFALDGATRTSSPAQSAPAPVTAVRPASARSRPRRPPRSACALPMEPSLAVLITRDCGRHAGRVAQPPHRHLHQRPAPGWRRRLRRCPGLRSCRLLCDVDPATGDGLGLFLVEYAYSPDAPSPPCAWSPRPPGRPIPLSAPVCCTVA
ncbi:hypothetical protein D3C59_17950 [Streptomyces sp. SHP22-7]|nr:hypothetical protein D3C59_17950 [Streptomyces sp. SHP22-7]